MRPRRQGLGLLALLILLPTLSAKPLSKEMIDRIQQRISTAVTEAASQGTPAESLAYLREHLHSAGSFTFEAAMVEAAGSYPGAEMEAWLGEILAKDDNAALRRKAAEVLGLHGSAAVAPLLARAAKQDPETDDYPGGCLVMRGDAREAAGKALEALKQRFPELDAGSWLQE